MSMSVTDIALELALLRAMFQLIASDSTSAEPSHRADVQRWLREDGPGWWDTFLGCDGALEQHMRRRLAERLAQHPRRESPQLAFRFSEEP